MPKGKRGKFEMGKGDASDFEIKRKPNRPYLDYEEFLQGGEEECR